jgi:hypothetical protein
MFNDIVCGMGTAVTAFAASEGLNLSTWESILVAIVSALIYAVLNVGSKILTSWLQKKGLITSNQKKKIDYDMDDLADDGKLNKSVENEQEEKKDIKK